MKIISWNVNGIRAAYKKGFLDFFQKEEADIFCIQESKAHEDQLNKELLSPSGYNSFWNIGPRKGYSGVGVFVKENPILVKKKFPDMPQFHEEGRVIELKFKKFTLLNIYFPNGGTRSDGTEMLSYKLRFYDNFLSYVNNLRQEGESVIVCGDFNIAHTEIDIARPKENENSIGFLPEERAKLDKVFKSGLVDVFRKLHPNLKDAYTWWSFRSGARERNVGWRLDYFVVSKDLIAKVKNISHRTDVFGSDHCPVVLEIFF